VFIALHGTYGEDGVIQAALELAGKIYTGSGVLASAVAMDKAMSKRVFEREAIPTPHWMLIEAGVHARSIDTSLLGGYPLIVKPNAEGSTVGLTVVRHPSELDAAIERASHHDHQILIEEYIEGRELYVSVLGNRRLTVFPPREIFFEHVPEDVPKFATFHAKWNEAYRKKWGITNGAARALPADTEKELRKLTRNVYRLLKIRGFGRIDMRLTPKQELFVIEANPNPSLAQDEEFSQAAADAGMGYDALIQAILETAFA